MFPRSKIFLFIRKLHYHIKYNKLENMEHIFGLNCCLGRFTHPRPRYSYLSQQPLTSGAIFNNRGIVPNRVDFLIKLQKVQLEGL